tara:strand:- start:341 stop:562 length:222 start_codon:yes stop_codon:yes gene_type:complete
VRDLDNDGGEHGQEPGSVTPPNTLSDSAVMLETGEGGDNIVVVVEGGEDGDGWSRYIWRVVPQSIATFTRLEH